MRRLLLAAGLLSLILVLTSCLRGGAPPFPSFDTMDEALSGVLKRPVEVVYNEPFGPGRAMVLFKTEQGGLSRTILQQTGKKWRMTDGVGINGPLPRLGALSYDSGALGRVETKRGTVTQISAEAHVVYGESFDPAITWVELTLGEPGAQPIRTMVRNGYWAVILPPEKQGVWFDLRAGDGAGERFTASVGGRRSSPNSPVVPRQYHDAQLGVRFNYPDESTYLRLDEQGRLVLGVSLIQITIKRQSYPTAGDPEEELIASTPREAEIVEHDRRTLGGHSAGYLLAVQPEEKADQFTYEMRYLVPVEDVAYIVTCATPHIYERSVWAKNWRPLCDQALAGVTLGD